MIEIVEAGDEALENLELIGRRGERGPIFNWRSAGSLRFSMIQ